MVGRLLFIGLLGIVLAGCASTQKTTMEQLQMRVGELERQLAEKDDEIADLQDDLDRANNEAKQQDMVVDEESTKISSKDSKTIRVGVSAGQVQIALKKAGYYNGAIDSKIGGNTKRAIMKFQKDNGLHADGVIGRRTWEKLKTYLE